jgi:hypothetical protein
MLPSAPVSRLCARRLLAAVLWSVSAMAVAAQVAFAVQSRAPDVTGSISGPAAALDISNIHRQPFFWTVMVASLIGWVLGMVKGFDSSKDWLAKYMKRVPSPLLFLVDLVIFVVVGAYVGTGLSQPATFSAALAAGLTWPVALGALASKTTPGTNAPGGAAHSAAHTQAAPASVTR